MPASSSTPRLRPWRRVHAVLLAVVLVVGACSGGGDDETTSTSPLEATTDERREAAAEALGPFAVEPDALAGPGTPLGGGLGVPDGALLQGVPFPDLVGSGYRAVLLLPEASAWSGAAPAWATRPRSGAAAPTSTPPTGRR